jgi:3-hydroxymyristoyl/3-hydroxydecanoyl-(acyl carrier protein) dehydratase
LNLLHRPPFLFVGDVRASEPPWLEVWAHFPEDNPYVTGGAVPRYIVVEALAQAVAVFAGREKGEALPGVLAMIRRVEFLRDVAPTERVFLRVKPLRWFGKLRQFSTSAFLAAHPENPVVSADIIVAETKETK